ncbi:MAG: protein O-mannosyl-transferase family [Caldilinea sp.]
MQHNELTPRHNIRLHRNLAGALLLLLALLLYGATLDNGLQPYELIGGDLITHQYAQVQARPGNAPGYPLYTMGGWLWFHGIRSAVQMLGIAAPNPLPILSGYSLLWALLALLLFYGILCHITRSLRHPAGNWLLAWLLSAFYAVTYFFWYYATTTEQYTSAIAQTLAIVYVYMLWREKEIKPSRDWRLEIDGGDNAPISNLQSPNLQSPNLQSPNLLILLAFLCGLSLAHMLTVAFIVPPLVLAILWERPQVLRNWRLVLACVVAAFLPLVSYVYVYVRGAANPQWWGAGEWTDANEWFWSFVSTAQGREELLWGFQPGCAFFDGGFPELIWGELSVPLLIIGVVGIALLGRKLAFVLYGTLVIYVIFNWMYRCGNWYQVILPAYPLVLIGAAAAFNRWEERFSGRSRWLGYASLALLIVAIVWRFDASWPEANSRNRPQDTALDRAAVLLDQPLPANAGLFAAVEDALALDYLISIWGVRPDLRVVSSLDAGQALRNGGVVLTTMDAATVLLEELPVDVTPPRAPFSADWLALGDMPANAHIAERVDASVIDAVTLAGYTVTPAPTGAPVIQAAPAVDVALFWQIKGAWPPSLGVSLRPTTAGAFIPDPATGSLFQRDATAPAQGLATSTPDTPIADIHRVPMPNGADGVMLIVYQVTDAGFENLLELPLAVE